MKIWIEGLQRTPDRAARALEFLTQGYRQDLDEIINDAIFDSEASEIIPGQGHRTVFAVRASLAPVHWTRARSLFKRKVIGLSKWRGSSMFLRADYKSGKSDHSNCRESLMNCLEPSGVADCRRSEASLHDDARRRKQNSVMKTSCLLGSFKEDGANSLGISLATQGLAGVMLIDGQQTSRVLGASRRLHLKPPVLE